MYVNVRKTPNGESSMDNPEKRASYKTTAHKYDMITLQTTNYKDNTKHLNFVCIVLKISRI